MRRPQPAQGPASSGVGASGLWGGSRAGQFMDSASYFTKEKIQQMAAIPWDERVLVAIDTSRALGCETPTELGYKNLASLCMMFESVDSPQFGPDERHMSYVAFKAAFVSRRDKTPKPALGEAFGPAGPPRQFPAVSEFMQKWPGVYRFAMDLALDTELHTVAPGLPAAGRTPLQFAALVNSFQCRPGNGRRPGHGQGQEGQSVNAAVQALRLFQHINHGPLSLPKQSYLQARLRRFLCIHTLVSQRNQTDCDYLWMRLRLAPLSVHIISGFSGHRPGDERRSRAAWRWRRGIVCQARRASWP